MKLFIPPLTTKLELLESWMFTLHREYRNHDAWIQLGLPTEQHHNYHQPVGELASAALPVGTILQVDRIFIRKGAEDYDSVTFLVQGGPNKALLTKSRGGTAPKACRFWVKLEDANKMDVKVVE
jgi:hypothetical protein